MAELMMSFTALFHPYNFAGRKVAKVVVLGMTSGDLLRLTYCKGIIMGVVENYVYIYTV